MGTTNQWIYFITSVYEESYKIQWQDDVSMEELLEKAEKMIEHIHM